MTEASTISHARAVGVGSGRLILVVGPSGAGKDTLLGLVREFCAEDPNIVFPRRVVTRPASASEDNEQMVFEAFQKAVGCGEFAIHWEAHGHRYALRRTIDADIGAGRTVVVNVSRTVIGAMRRAYADVAVISITAPPEVLAERLAARGRSSDGKIENRLGRIVDDESATPDFIIVNMSSAEYHARQLLRIIKAE